MQSVSLSNYSRKEVERCQSLFFWRGISVKKSGTFLPEKIVDIVFQNPISMCGIRRDSMDSKVSLDVVDDIGRVIDIPHSSRRCCTEIAGGSRTS